VTEILNQQVRDNLATTAAVADLVPLVVQVGEEICQRLGRGGTVFTFGNGGSAADAQHLAAELIGRYRRDRRPVAAIALSTDPSVTTCIANDFGYEVVFSRQVIALVNEPDVVVAFSTSGTSPTVVSGLAAARRAGALTVLFTGHCGTDASTHADRVLRIASTATARIQEGHLLLHLLSEQVDQWAAGETDNVTSV
jgi:D-sedoheptulose 7-phosphate isomerase